MGQNSSSVQMASVCHLCAAVLVHVARSGRLDADLDERSLLFRGRSELKGDPLPKNTFFKAEQLLDENSAVAKFYAASGYAIGTRQCRTLYLTLQCSYNISRCSLQIHFLYFVFVFLFVP